MRQTVHAKRIKFTHVSIPRKKPQILLFIGARSECACEHTKATERVHRAMNFRVT